VLNYGVVQHNLSVFTLRFHFKFCCFIDLLDDEYDLFSFLIKSLQKPTEIIIIKQCAKKVNNHIIYNAILKIHSSEAMHDYVTVMLLSIII